MKTPYLSHIALYALLKVNKIELVTPGWKFPCKCTVCCDQSPLLISSSAVLTTREKNRHKRLHGNHKQVQTNSSF